MIPLLINCRRNSSSCSSLRGLIIQHTSFSIWGMNQMRMAVLIKLKAVWKAASAKESCVGDWLSAMGSRPTRPQTIRTKGKKKMSTHSTPNRLNKRCAIAVRRAWVLADMAARLAVTVVPMFSPITSAIPWKMVMAPVEQSTMVMAIRAAEDCTMAVRIEPMRRNSKMVP